MGGGLVVEGDDVGGVEHEWCECRITGEGRRSNVGADEWEDCRG